MGKIKVFGIKVDDSCGQHLKIIKDFAGSGNSDERKTANKSVRKLGDKGCNKALKSVAIEYAGSGNSDERKTAEIAVEELAKNKANKRLREIVQKLGGSGNSDERELADKALELIE